jgi:hypothetical protein
VLYEIGEGEVACCTKHGLAAEGRGEEMGEIKSLSTFTLFDYFSRNLTALLSV